ncbi:hypothetical protein SPHINGO391_390257 [Sphingomonas aurantiaca]|uniref:Uncharacterized protein n=1 Tax=Sphingomonas aurantiaca TaxID=185949 RepID=A0A5E7YRH8_9SPHN|nr:hypothetical protein [Sphingomonas aurantiaca]VVT09004.1 hypothetical protein SPHINGO391_390257 [Sphingomonas aurantiaca]
MVDMGDLARRIQALEKTVEQLQAQVNTHAVDLGKPEKQISHAPKGALGRGVVERPGKYGE